MKKIVEVLRQTFKKINIGKTGYAFLLNGKGELLISPRGFQEEEFAELNNQMTGKLIINDLMKCAKEEIEKIRYIEVRKSNVTQEIEAHVRYFTVYVYNFINDIAIIAITHYI